MYSFIFLKKNVIGDVREGYRRGSLAESKKSCIFSPGRVIINRRNVSFLEFRCSLSNTSLDSPELTFLVGNCSLGVPNWR